MRVSFDPRKQMSNNHRGGVMESLRVLRVPRDPRDPSLEPVVAKRVDDLRGVLRSVAAVRVSWDRVGDRAKTGAELHIDDVAHARLFDEMTGHAKDPRILGLRLRAEDTARAPENPAWEPAVHLRHEKLKQSVQTLEELRLSWARAAVETEDKGRNIEDVAHARRFDELKDGARGQAAQPQEETMLLGLRLRAQETPRKPENPSLELWVHLRQLELRRSAATLESLNKSWALVTEDRLSQRDFAVENIAHARRYDQLAAGRDVVTREERQERLAGAALATRYRDESAAFRDRSPDAWERAVRAQKERMSAENLTHEELTRFIDNVEGARDLALAREDKFMAARMWARLCAASELACELLERKAGQHQISLF